MGFGMAQNLRKKLPVEDTVYVFDINPAATAALQQAGVIVSPTIHHLVENSVLSLLPLPPGAS